MNIMKKIKYLIFCILFLACTSDNIYSPPKIDLKNISKISIYFKQKMIITLKKNFKDANTINQFKTIIISSKLIKNKINNKESVGELTIFYKSKNQKIYIIYYDKNGYKLFLNNKELLLLNKKFRKKLIKKLFKDDIKLIKFMEQVNSS